MKESSCITRQDSADDQPRFCNVFAKFWKCICRIILQCICQGFAMHSPGLRKVIARSLLPGSTARATRVERSSSEKSCK
jgi:hypothetical protein